jgi:hypothetical protein
MAFNDVIEKIGMTIDAARVVVVVTDAAIVFAADAVRLSRRRIRVPRRSDRAGGGHAPTTAPASMHAASSMMSLPPSGTECKNSTAAVPTASPGPCPHRRSPLAWCRALSHVLILPQPPRAALG